jgi:hypothetical protein
MAKSKSVAKKKVAKKAVVEAPIEPINKTPAPADPMPIKKGHKKLIIILCSIGGLLVIAAIILVIIFTMKDDGGGNVKQLEANNNQVTDPDGEKQRPSNEPSDVVRWNATQYDQPGLICATYMENEYDRNGNIVGAKPVDCPTFTNVATLGNGKLLVRADDMQCWFLVDGVTDTVQLIQSSLGCSSNLTQETVRVFGVRTPEKLISSGQSFTAQFYSESSFAGYSAASFPLEEGYSFDTITTIDGNPLYRISLALEKDGWTGKNLLKQQRYATEMPDTSIYTYDLDSAKIQNDDGTLKVNWDSSANARVTFQSPTRGCGIMGTAASILLFTPSADDLIELGTVSSTGEPIYKLARDDIMQLFYQEYTAFRDDAVPYSSFLTATSIVVFRDSMGDWNVLQNTAYGPAGECAKPVVYLYPTKTTDVSVQVGANVRISEPTYPTGGWKNVTAQPNGTLSYGGKMYDSLFWEGKGWGAYPDVTGVGTVVAQKDVISTIRQQLVAQGLNNKEINDFVEFWANRLPKTPYVKLTWLNKASIDRLAPLTVTPEPDTVIRVFLDAEGLSFPVNTIPQVLQAPSRDGFTVVEWGGLMY